MFRVLISGFYGFDNAGDEAILQSMVTGLRKAHSDVDIVVLSADPSKTERDHGVKAVDRSNLLQIFSAVKDCDMLISGGGGLFQDVTSISSLWYYSGIIIIGFLLKKPVFAYAQGIGPVKWSFDKKLLRYIINRVYKISVRDEKSRLELRNLGITREVSCTADPAFLIDLASKEESLEILARESGIKETGRPKIGFTVRSRGKEPDISTIFAEVADRAFEELGADIVFFPLHYGKDIELAEEIAGKMKHKPIIIRGSYPPSQLAGLYGVMDLNLGVRLHGLIFSLMNNVPMVAVSYDPKVDSFMDSVGVESQVLCYDKLTSDSIFEAIRERWMTREAEAGLIQGKVDKFKALARKGMEELVSAVDELKQKKEIGRKNKGKPIAEK